MHLSPCQHMVPSLLAPSSSSSSPCSASPCLLLSHRCSVVTLGQSSVHLFSATALLSTSFSYCYERGCVEYWHHFSKPLPWLIRSLFTCRPTSCPVAAAPGFRCSPPAYRQRWRGTVCNSAHHGCSVCPHFGLGFVKETYVMSYKWLIFVKLAE